MFLSRHSSGFLVCLAVVVLFSAVSANAAPFTNWTESFEGYNEGTVLNTNGWSTGIADPQGVVTSTASYHGSNNCALPAEGVLTNLIDGTGASVVWADFFAKIATRDEVPPVQSEMSVQFYFNENSNAVVRDGSLAKWVTLSNTVGGAAATRIDPAEWTRITVVQNYTDKKWALIVGDELLDDNIGFINAGVTKLNAFVVSNQVSLDSMVFSANSPSNNVTSPSNTTLVGDADTDGMPDFWEIDYFGYAYIESAGDDFDKDGRSSSVEFTQGTDPTVIDTVPLSLPYRDGFDSADVGSITNASWRSLLVSGGVTVQSSDYIQGTKALTLSTGSVNVVISDAAATNVWVQIYSKPQPYAANPPAPLANDQVAGFILTTNGDLMAWSSNEWVTCNTVTDVATNEWMGFAVHLDYSASNYDLYVSTNATFGKHMRRAHNAPFGFNTNATATALSKIVVTNKSEDVGYLDLIASSYAYTNVGVGALTNLAASDRIAGKLNNVSRPPYDYELFGGINNTLTNGSRLASDLMRELVHNDRIIVNTNGFNIYSYSTNAPASWQYFDGAVTNTGEIVIGPSMALGIDRRGAGGVDAVAFYPYSNIVSGATISITGTNTVGVWEGWNHFTTHFDPPKAPASYGFTGAVPGDRIFFDDGYWIYYTTSGWKWGVEYTTRTLGAETIWYYHRGSGITYNTGP